MRFLSIYKAAERNEPPTQEHIATMDKLIEEMTSSGIFLPDTAKEKPQRGTIIAVGKGRLNEKGERVEMDVKQGDSVLFAKYAGTEFKLDDDELLLKPTSVNPGHRHGPDREAERWQPVKPRCSRNEKSRLVRSTLNSTN